MLFQEKEMYEHLWKRTSHILERELPTNSIAKVKKITFLFKRNKLKVSLLVENGAWY
jgi:hypothetical protein